MISTLQSQEQSHQQQTTITIGYYFSTKKQNSSICQCFKNNNIIYNNIKFIFKYIDMINIDINNTIQYKCDILLYKATDIQVSALLNNMQDINNIQRIEQLITYLQHQYNTIILYSLHQINNVLNRITMYNLLHNMIQLNNNYRVEIPYYSELSNMNNDTTIQYPVIIKHKIACGTIDSHQMYIIYNTIQFNTIVNTLHNKNDWLYQQYIQHNIMYKVYVLGTNVWYYIVNNNNTSTSINNNNNELYTFNSQTIHKQYVQPNDNNIDTDTNSIYNIIQQISQYSTTILQFDIYGFDLIIDQYNHTNLYIIDINYFPSYKQVNNFDTYLYQYLIHKYNKHKES